MKSFFIPKINLHIWKRASENLPPNMSMLANDSMLKILIYLTLTDIVSYKYGFYVHFKFALRDFFISLHSMLLLLR
jgi:hypothetical protein